MPAKPLVRVLLALALLGGAWVGLRASAEKAGKKEPPARKSGTVVASLTAKGPH
jgi:hypothetical protein